MNEVLTRLTHVIGVDELRLQVAVDRGLRFHGDRPVWNVTVGDRVPIGAFAIRHEFQRLVGYFLFAEKQCQPTIKLFKFGLVD